MMKLKAERSLLGDYGQVHPGDVFETNEEVGKSLVQRGLASEATAADEKAAAKKADEPSNKATKPASNKSG